MTNYQTLETRLSFEVFPKRDITIVKGEGATLWDSDGKPYIDCTAGVGVANIGHANANVAAALTEQANRLITCPGVFYNDVRARLLEKLVALSPEGLNRVFLCNSGTEANEAAIKFARHSTGKSQFVCAMRGFHGRTMGALSATHKHRNQFEPLIPGFSFVPFNNSEKLEAAMNDNTAAVILEIVQGEGGVRVGEQAFFEKAQTLCQKYGAMLIVDEIQTGFCRTGTMFACEQFDVRPDMMSLAKGIAGGVPMGAVLCGDAVKADVGMHGTTFGGNPLAAAAALAAIDFMQDNHLAEQAAKKGAHLVKKLTTDLPARVREVRHLGLMIGIELKEKSKPFLVALMEQGVLALPAGATVIRLLPPLVISTQQLDEVGEKLLCLLAETPHSR